MLPAANGSRRADEATTLGVICGDHTATCEICDSMPPDAECAAQIVIGAVAAPWAGRAPRQRGARLRRRDGHHAPRRRRLTRPLAARAERVPPAARALDSPRVHRRR